LLFVEYFVIFFLYLQSKIGHQYLDIESRLIVINRKGEIVETRVHAWLHFILEHFMFKGSKMATNWISVYH